MGLNMQVPSFAGNSSHTPPAAHNHLPSMLSKDKNLGYNYIPIIMKWTHTVLSKSAEALASKRVDASMIYFPNPPSQPPPKLNLGKGSPSPIFRWARVENLNAMLAAVLRTCLHFVENLRAGEIAPRNCFAMATKLKIELKGGADNEHAPQSKDSNASLQPVEMVDVRLLFIPFLFPPRLAASSFVLLRFSRPTRRNRGRKVTAAAQRQQTYFFLTHQPCMTQKKKRTQTR